MKARTIGLGTAGALALSLLVVMKAAPPLHAQGGGSDQKFKYDGNNSCKKCHVATYKSWEQTPHGKALETLKPGNATEAKAKFNLDPNKDYTQDPKCLECHTVGFGKEGGYAIPDPSDSKAVRAAQKTSHVGCESCHGPGESYAKVFKEIMTSQRKYTLAELQAAGLQVPSEQTCVGCHNDRSPTFNAGQKFDFEEMKKKGVHEHAPLKLRQG